MQNRILYVIILSAVLKIAKIIFSMRILKGCSAVFCQNSVKCLRVFWGISPAVNISAPCVYKRAWHASVGYAKRIQELRSWATSHRALHIWCKLLHHICRGIEAVITGLTRNQFVPKAHEGSNPSLCAKWKTLENADFPSVFKVFSTFMLVPKCSEMF